MNNEKISAYFNKLKSDKKIQLIAIIILASIMLICLLFNPVNNKKSSDNNEDAISLYVKTLEDKLSNTLSKVEKAGDVSVMITLSSGIETVLATKTTKTETQNGTEIVETPIIVNGKTIVIKENLPKIMGVLIVADGASDFAVLNRIQQATMSLLNIELNQIEILTKK